MSTIESVTPVEATRCGSVPNTRLTRNSQISQMPAAPATVKKRNMMDMDKSYYPKDFVVPLIDVVHNRISEEVLRGCIRGCRFCQAGFLYRPYREKSIETIDRQCRDLCHSTGYDEISLSSLSTSDYARLNELIDTLHQWTEGEKAVP